MPKIRVENYSHSCLLHRPPVPTVSARTVTSCPISTDRHHAPRQSQLPRNYAFQTTLQVGSKQRHQTQVARFHPQHTFAKTRLAFTNKRNNFQSQTHVCGRKQTFERAAVFPPSLSKRLDTDIMRTDKKRSQQSAAKSRARKKCHSSSRNIIHRYTIASLVSIAERMQNLVHRTDRRVTFL